MESLILFSLTISSLILLLYGLYKAFYSIWWTPKMKEKLLKGQGIRGTPYKLIIGDLKEFVRQRTDAWSKPLNLTHEIEQRVDPFTFNTVQEYGKISYCWFGTTPKVIIEDPQLMKEVLSNKQDHFGKPPLNPLILILTKGLTTLEGDVWARHRRIINPAFHLDRLKGMISIFSSSCQTMIEQWSKSADDQGTYEIDVWPEFQHLTGDIISRAAFGSNFEQGRQILGLQKELQVLVIEAMQTLYIPGFRFVPTKKNRKRISLDKEITSMLRTLIRTKEDEMRRGTSRTDDLLSVLLQSTKQDNEETSERKKKTDYMTIEEVIEECKVFYLAGHETTSCWMTWIVIVLAMHQNWQEKAREEVVGVLQGKSPDFEAINHLKVVTMIVNEVLRLYPPVIAHYPWTKKDTKIGELCIPKGTLIDLPTLLVHHDSELWGDDADEFKPERFSEGVAKASKENLAFFPFGWGPRSCIGQNFAIFEVKVTLAIILQNFTFELSPCYAHAPNTGMTLQPQHGAQVIFRKLM